MLIEIRFLNEAQSGVPEELRLGDERQACQSVALEHVLILEHPRPIDVAADKVWWSSELLQILETWEGVRQAERDVPTYRIYRIVSFDNWAFPRLILLGIVG